MENLKYWIWLSRIKNLGSVRIQKLLNIYISPKEIWKLKKEELLSIDGIGEKIANEILDEKYKFNLEKIEQQMKKENIELITLEDEFYSKNLKQIYDKPICVYVKGDKRILNDFSLAIIGCRDCSEYGKRVAQTLGKTLAKEKITTISGLARGIDGISQNATVSENGKTIAVIGSGICNIYPKENIKLANEIIKKGGVIVSEYVPNEKAEKLNFPARNRIISGISSGVIVVEAKNKSGTMTTVDFALEQGKNVFAIPRKCNKYKFARNQ